MPLPFRFRGYRKPAKSFLMVGPPGSGKTLLVEKVRSKPCMHTWDHSQTPTALLASPHTCMHADCGAERHDTAVGHALVSAVLLGRGEREDPQVSVRGGNGHAALDRLHRERPGNHACMHVALLHACTRTACTQRLITLLMPPKSPLACSALPCLALQDEVDALAGQRSSSDDASSRRLLTELLLQMTRAAEQDALYVFACTNRIQAGRAACWTHLQASEAPGAY
jgi:hypothetical protein